MFILGNNLFTRRISIKKRLCNPARGTVLFLNFLFKRTTISNEKSNEKMNTIKKDKMGKLTANRTKKSKSPMPNTLKMLFSSITLAYRHSTPKTSAIKVTFIRIEAMNTS
jgi:hypothetical protein